MILINDLRLGDVVQLFDQDYGTAMVTKVTPSEVTMFRPYATTADFEYTGGVIPYMGFEIVNYPRENVNLLKLHRRGNLK